MQGSDNCMDSEVIMNAGSAIFLELPWNEAYNPLRIFPCCNQNCFWQGIIIFFTNMGVGGIIYEAIQKFIYINKIQTGKLGCLPNPPWTSR